VNADHYGLLDAFEDAAVNFHLEQTDTAERRRKEAWNRLAAAIEGASKYDEVDRNARAYGWEAGRCGELRVSYESSSDNPFLDPDWRDAIHDAPEETR
jgi:hypothetical protein